MFRSFRQHKHTIAVVLIALILVFTLILPCHIIRVRAFTAAQHTSLEAQQIAVSRERFLKSAAIHKIQAESSYDGSNSMLQGNTYVPVLDSMAWCNCVNLVTQVIYTATASTINDAYHTIEETMTTAHDYADSNGIVLDAQNAPTLRTQLLGASGLYQSSGSGTDPASLQLGDIVLTGDKNRQAIDHVVLVLGPISSQENEWMNIPGYDANKGYFISRTQGQVEYVDLSRFNQPFSIYEPDEGYFIKNVFRPRYNIADHDLGGLRFKNIDASSADELTGAVFQLDGPRGFCRTIAMGPSGYDSGETLVPGTYWLTQIEAPPGYRLDPEERTIEVGIGATHDMYWHAPISNEWEGEGIDVFLQDADTTMPIAGALFELSRLPSFPADSSFQEITDENGRTKAIPFMFEHGDCIYVRALSLPPPATLENTLKTMVLQKDGPNTVEFCSHVAKGEIKVSLRDEANDPIAQAAFQIEDEHQQIVSTFLTDEEGRGKSELLPLGSYQLVQQTAPPGYAPNDQAHEVHLCYQDMVTPVVASSLTLHNECLCGTIAITNVESGNSQPVEGACFELLNEHYEPALDFDGNEVGVLVTNDMGSVVSPSLLKGCYRVRQWSVPEAFFPNEQVFDIQFDVHEKNKSLLIENERVLFHLKILAKNADTAAPMRGVTFQILLRDEQAMCLTTDDEGVAYSPEALGAGHYILQMSETPQGFATCEAIGFVIDRYTGDVLVERSMKITKLNISCHPTVVTFSCKDKASNEMLSGAQLKLYKKSDENGEDTLIDEWISDGTIKTMKGLEVGASYVLREIQAPKGYVLSDECVFTVADTGAAQSMDLLHCRTAVRLIKCDVDTGERLQGVEFEIENALGQRMSFVREAEAGRYIWAALTEGAASSVLVTDEEGVFDVSGLPIGLYTLRETRWLPDYESRGEDIYFAVEAHSDDNHPVSLEVKNKKESGEGDLPQDDRPLTEVLLKKTDTDNPTQVLEGAMYELYAIEDDFDVEPERFIRDGACYIACDRGQTTRLKTDADGLIRLESLPYGSYRLIECEAPTGYVVDEEAIVITLREEEATVFLEHRNRKIEAGAEVKGEDRDPSSDDGDTGWDDDPEEIGEDEGREHVHEPEVPPQFEEPHASEKPEEDPNPPVTGERPSLAAYAFMLLSVLSFVLYITKQRLDRCATDRLP